MKPKILIVDDSNIVLNMHAYILESSGYSCAVAENGYVALELLFREPFQLIVTDVNMPKMDGYELTRRIRSSEQYRDTPVIMISTEREAADKIRGMEAGANVYMVKPTQPEALVTKVNMLLA